MEFKLPPLPAIEIDGSMKEQVWLSAKEAQAYATKAVREALEAAASQIVELADGHARQAGEERGDPECDFQTAWDDAANLVRSLKPELDDADA